MKVEISELLPLFRNAFNNQDLSITEKSDRHSIAEWDSMGHLNLIVELEDNLNVSFTKDEIESIRSIKELMEILESK